MAHPETSSPVPGVTVDAAPSIVGPLGEMIPGSLEDFTQWIGSSGYDLPWFFSLRLDQQQEVVAFWWKNKHSEFDPATHTRRASQQRLQAIENTEKKNAFLHDDEFIAGVYQPLAMHLENENPEAAKLAKAREKKGPAPKRPDLTPEDAAKEAEDLNWKRLLNVDDIFLPPVYQPLSGALVRQYADSFAESLLGRKLTREEQKQAEQMFRGIEKSAYQRQKKLAKMQAQRERIEQAIAENEATTGSGVDISKAFQLAQQSLDEAGVDQLPEAPAPPEEEATQTFSKKAIKRAQKEFSADAAEGVPSFSAEESQAEFNESLTARANAAHPWDLLGTQLRRLIVSSQQQGGF